MHANSKSKIWLIWDLGPHPCTTTVMYILLLDPFRFAVEAKFVLRALKSPQKFRSPRSANFLGSCHISGLKSKSYYEIWTFWSQIDLQMIQFHSFYKWNWDFLVDFQNHRKINLEEFLSSKKLRNPTFEQGNKFFWFTC